MKIGEVVSIGGERYIVSDCSVLGAALTHLDKDGNLIEGEWIILPKNGICRLLMVWDKSLRAFLIRRWLYLCVLGVISGTIVLGQNAPVFIEAITIGASFGDCAYYGFLTLVGLFDFVGYGVSLLYGIRRPQQRAEEEELEE